MCAAAAAAAPRHDSPLTPRSAQMSSRPASRQNRASLPKVAEAPSPGTVFTFERAVKTHCIENVCYTLDDGSREEAYFKPRIASVLKDAAYAPEAEMNTILSAAKESWANGAEFEIKFLKFMQLQLWFSPEGIMDRGKDSDGRDMGDITYVPAGKWITWTHVGRPVLGRGWSEP